MRENSVLGWFKPAPFKPKITDQKALDKAYRYWRIRIFYAMYVGYVFFYFTRKAFTFVIPEMVKDLGFSYSQLGILSTVLYISYGISKFASGVMADRSNPRYFMAVGLILTGVFNILFGLSSSITMLALFCGLNGWFQGWGWPAITKQLTHWYAQHERGTWWSVCSTSHNVGGALIPVIVAQCALASGFGLSGWRFAVVVPGVMCVVVGFWLLNRLRDIPQTLGLPSIEEYKGRAKTRGQTECEATILSPRQILFEKVLNNRFVWIMALTYFFVYVIRTAINDWTVPYLVDVLHFDRILASASIAWFEMGGFVGMLLAGWASDLFFQGRRVPLMIACAIGMGLSLYAFWQLPADGFVIHSNFLAAMGWADVQLSSIFGCYILMALIGFFVFGPQMLVGLAAAEYVDKKAACTANGFVGCWAYVGAAATGFPLGAIIDNSWDNYYLILVICSLFTLGILLPLGLRKHNQPQMVHPSWNEEQS